MTFFYYLIALVAGLLLPLQIAFNNKLSTYTLNPFTTSLISFTTGTIALMAYSLLNYNKFNNSLMLAIKAPWFAWLGGLLGAFYIISTIITSSKIGLATFLAIVIGGQLLMSLFIDHFGLFGTAVKLIDIKKVSGILFVLIGIWLIKSK